MFLGMSAYTMCNDVLTETLPSYRLAQSYFGINLLISFMAKEIDLLCSVYERDGKGNFY